MAKPFNDEAMDALKMKKWKYARELLTKAISEDNLEKHSYYFRAIANH